MKARTLVLLVALLCAGSAWGKGGVPFNPITDIHWGEIEFEIVGVCFCPKIIPPGIVIFVPGLIVKYWEPFLLEETVSVPFYSPMLGVSTGTALLDELGGKNSSADPTNVTNESTFTQAHAYLMPITDLIPVLCSNHDIGMWESEFDPTWQSDELSAIITPEAALFANKEMQMACMADAAAVNVGWPLDDMPWCIGSSGSSYPMTGHVDNDNIVQANNTVASRLIYKLNRIGMICDPADNPCGCNHTPVWIKSHYKMHVARPDNRSPAYPVGKAAEFYATGLNPPYTGAMGSNDEFLWVVYRKQMCCTCCD